MNATFHPHLKRQHRSTRRAATCIGLSMGVAASVLTFASAASAQESPGTENGRYVLSQTTDGILKLDTRSGTVSACSNAGGSWVCRLVPDERLALDLEIGRLQAENKVLKDRLAQIEAAAAGKNDTPSAQADPRKLPADKNSEFQLPADHARLMALLDRVWQQLIDMADRVQKKLSEKI